MYHDVKSAFRNHSKLTGAHHDKFGPRLCLNVFSLNTCCGCRNYLLFWIHFKFIFTIIKVFYMHT
jgi:hypothetical protein